MLTIVFSSLLFLSDGDANQMVSMCRNVNEVHVTHQDNLNLRECYGWVLGVAEVLNNEVFMSGDNDQQCIPVGVTQRQLVRIFLKYVEEHPKLLRLPRAYVIKIALIDAFQCVSQDH